MPRRLALQVVEHRTPRPDESEETMSRLAAAITGTLAEAGVQVQTPAANRLVVIVSYPDVTPEEFSRDACVRVQARLSMQGGAQAESQSDACFEMRHLIGVSLGADATKAFRAATSQMLEGLDTQVSKLTGVTPTRTQL